MSERISGGLQKIRKVADYQFGGGVGERLFPDGVDIVFSRRTGKIRHIYLHGQLLATLKPTDGLFSLTTSGAKRLLETVQPKRIWVQVQDEAVPFVEKGHDVFAKHVAGADEEIRPGEEVIVLDRGNRVIAVGRATLSGEEMKEFNRGVAVRVRKGDLEKVKKDKATLVDK